MNSAGDTDNAGGIAPEYRRFVAGLTREARPRSRAAAPAAAPATAQATVPPRAPAEGEVGKSLVISAAQLAELLPVAARRASGLFRPGTQREVVWVDGDSELAVSLVGLRARCAEGLVVLTLPVRCDQTGSKPVAVHVHFACGSPRLPTGLYAAAERLPRGPELVVAVWGEALVAFAWQCLLGVITGLAGASAKDARGNVLVPVEMLASTRGLEIVPMARHRFAGSSGLKPGSTAR